MDTFKNFWQKARPDGVDFAYATIFSALLMVLGNLGTILDAYDVAGTRQFVQSQAGQNITGFLAKIDDFEFSKTVVLFLFWCFVGLIVYFIVQSILSANSKYSYQKEVGSGQYTHPESFDQKAYQQFLLRQRIVHFCSLMSLLVSFILAMSVLLPFANNHFENLVSEFSFGSLVLTILGLGLLSIGLLAIGIAFQAVRNREMLAER
ncbi:MAG: hypothetical protein QG629_223 [Patescibacteria group bacterium]|nr:hypothetical protein [Candidatus Saccharibacteria bacterium]MDQ5963141.1 hypothetical protein [Patescibacteria group bacterium]